MYTASAQLNADQHSAIKRLLLRCKQHDSGIPLVYPDLLLQKRSQHSNWMAFDNGQCIAFASVYYFYSDGCEIALCVDPSNRRQGHAKNICKKLWPQFSQKGVQRLVFTLGTNQQQHWLKEKGLSYLSSEFEMQREGYHPKLTGKSDVHIQLADAADIDNLCEIDKQCFSHHPEMKKRFAALLENPKYTVLTARYEGKLIGKAHVYWQKDAAIFSDIAILPSFQKRGFGSQLLAGTIAMALKKGVSRQKLSVATKNIKALDLYQQYGFKIHDAHDYWEMPIDTFEHWLLPSIA